MTARTCATCKWVMQPGQYAKCGRLGDPRSNIDPLTGFEPFVKPAPYVEQVRYDNDKCGPEGRWWEPVESETQGEAS